MTATTRLAQKRLTLLQLAEKLGNFSKACLMHKVSRSQFFESVSRNKNRNVLYFQEYVYIYFEMTMKKLPSTIQPF